MDDHSETAIAAEKPKKQKQKKRPSDFELIRTIIQRTSERKQVYLLKNLGEDNDILFLCTANEEEFKYGSPEFSFAIIEFTDDETKTMAEGVLTKLYGYNQETPFAGFISLRDQISDLAKTKGETFSEEIHTNKYGSAWVKKTDRTDNNRIVYYSLAIDSLFHVEQIRHYCKTYRPLLTSDDPSYLYHSFRLDGDATATMITLPPPPSNHQLYPSYPFGFRALMTKGLDLIVTKSIDEHFPYPIEQEDIIVHHDQSTVCHLVHRVVAKGWRMIMVRPNAILFPIRKAPLPNEGPMFL